MSTPGPPRGLTRMLVCAAAAASCGPALPDPTLEVERSGQGSLNPPATAPFQDEEPLTYTIPLLLPEPAPAPARALAPASDPNDWPLRPKGTARPPRTTSHTTSHTTSTASPPPTPWAPAPWMVSSSRFPGPPAPGQRFARDPGLGCPSGMATIRGGAFTMGTDDEEDKSQPRRQVTLPTYCLDLTEVTVGAYARCPSCRAPADGPLCNVPGAGKDDHPQNCVSWDDAVAYCAWAGKALPTEAQWEYAARGGSSQRRWPWGDSAPTRNRACWSRWDPQDRGTCPAGAFPEGAFGLKDMAGNVWEWVDAWYGPFAPDDPIPTPTSGAGRVLRGGGWSSTSAANLLSSSRAATWPTNRDDYLGFRCAL